MKVYVVLVEQWDIEAPQLYLDSVYANRADADARAAEVIANKAHYYPHPSDPIWADRNEGYVAFLKENGIDLSCWIEREEHTPAWVEERDLL